MTQRQKNQIDLLSAIIENAPLKPGVYRMLDADRKIIYIGKAKNLKNRLKQYIGEVTGKTAIMISLTHFLEISVTESESAALLLEGQLIKKFKPKYNILLKDDKSFPYIKLRLDHPFPQLLKYRGKDLKDGKFFGPFASAGQVEVTLQELQKIFKLRSCSDSYFASRKRPCLQYQINKCTAPCVGKISKEDYDDLVTQVKTYLSGKNKSLQEVLAVKMQELSEALQFEEAAKIRDRIKALSYIQLKAESSGLTEDTDLIAIKQINGEYCAILYIYRSGQACGHYSYFPEHTDNQAIDAVLEAFILQLYQTNIPAKNITLSHKINNIAVFEKALKELHGVSVKISLPKLGPKTKLIEIALENAQIALEQRIKSSAKNQYALEEVKKLFDLPEIPNRIEVYDNSHIQGAFAIGAMIVAGKEGFEKKEYRLFNIRGDETSLGGRSTAETSLRGAQRRGNLRKNDGPYSQPPGIATALTGPRNDAPPPGIVPVATLSRNDGYGDDYAMLKEVLTRKFTRLKSEPQRLPDLMIIDGGKGHMGVVLQTMEKFGLDIPFVCMSKGVDRNSGREQFHRPNHEPFTLDKNLPVMKYLQILRDEVHNFAIKNHRKKRARAINISSLDHIPGIGAKRKKALLSYFGSLNAIADATIEELTQAEGISKELAQTIYERLRGQ